MLELPLFLLTLVDAYEAFIEDAGRDTKLKLVLFDLIVKEFNYTDVRAFLVMHAHADVSRTQLVLLEGALVLLGQLIQFCVVGGHLFCEPVESDHHGCALFDELCDFLRNRGEILYRQSG